MKRLVYSSILIILWLGCSVLAFGQRPVAYDSPNYEYKTATELFQKGQYGAAQEYFQFVYENTTDQQYDLKTNSYFYQGVCAAKLNNGNAAFLLKDFIRKYPIHSCVPDARFYLARYYFFKKDYKRALENFDEIDERTVRNSDLAEYYFKKGYANLVKGDKDDAKYLFRKASEYEGPYQQKAVYYRAHIAYEEGQYIAALEDFKSLEGVKEFSATVPFYIAQIHFLDKDYETVVETAPDLLSQSTDKAELNRIIALSHYNLGNYEQADRYFEDFLALNEKAKTGARVDLPASDCYAIGFTKYRRQQYKAAVDYLSKATKENDALAQSAYYIIGDCQIKAGQPRLSVQSFLEASKMDYDAEIQEDAYYNYAKLQYETASAPFSNAITALEDYVKRYPYSTRSEEATAYLAKIYASSRNYPEAIKSIEQLSSMSPEIMRSYQRCTHFRALQLINNKDYKNAGKMLEKSLKYPVDSKIHLSNLYWKAEALYRAEEYQKAYTAFQVYHKSNGVTSNPNYTPSLYSYGYAAMKSEAYREAQQSFEKYLATDVTEDNYRADALARLGDCYFMQRKLQNAITNYEKCEKLKSLNADYALYQIGRCYGYLNNNTKKVQTMEKFTQLYGKSSYMDKVEYELANTYHSQNQYSKAISAYQEFIRKYPKSSYVREAHNKLAQAYLNSQETDKSIATFKKVIEQYPGSQEAKDALANLESIYTEQGRTGEFFEYIKSKGNISISPERQDSITYRAAESKYLKGNCEMATNGFNDYIKNFPEGYFIAEARFYRAECAYGRNSFDEALADYENLIQNYRTSHNEVALRKAASILFNKGEFQRALDYFKELLACATNENNSSYAYNGIMRCAFELKNYQEAFDGAKGYLTSPSADPEYKEDAQLIAGESAYFLRNYTAVKKYLAPLAKKSTSDISAEAAYYCALSEFTQGNLDECEKEIGEILEASYTSGYWLASTFILYGDFYFAKENYFQARATYQSIVDNYDGEDLRQVARGRIAKIDAIENPEPVNTPAPNNGFDNQNNGNGGNDLRPVDED